MQKNKWLLILFLCLCISPEIFGKLERDKKIICKTLPNGLTYYIYPNANPKGEAVFRLFIRSGSVLEDENQRGLAHFLEHMAFNGTRNFPADGIVRFLESKGARFGKDLNAHTGFNETVYKLQLPTHDAGFLDSTLLILSDWAGGIVFDSLQIEKERGVILSEWLSKQGPSYEAQSALLFEVLNNSRYASRLTIGDTAVIRNFKRQELVDYYHQWYNPALMAVAVVGDVDASQVEKMIRTHFGYLPKQKIRTQITYPIPPFKQENVRLVKDSTFQKTELSVLRILPLLPGVKSEKEYPTYLRQFLLNRLLRNRFSELSFHQLSFQKGSWSVSDFINTTRVLLGSVEFIPGKEEEGLKAFLSATQQMMKFGFTSNEIEKIRKRTKRELQRKAANENQRESKHLMNEIYSDFYQNNLCISPQKEYELFERYSEGIDSALFVKELQQMFNMPAHYLFTSYSLEAPLFADEKGVQAFIQLCGSEQVQPYRKDFDVPEALLENEPEGGRIIRQAQIPEIGAESYWLSNGVRVIYKRSDAEKNRITVSGFRKGGLYALDSTDYVTGLYAGAVVNMSGAGEFSRDALNQFLSGNTASIRFLIDKTRTGILGTASTDDQEDLFSLLFLKWNYPLANPDIYNQVKQKAKQIFLTSKKSAADQFLEEVTRQVQGATYANRIISDSVLESEFHFERVLPVFNKCFGAANDFAFTILTDQPFDEIRPLVEKYLATLPTGETQLSYVYRRPQSPKHSLKYEKMIGNSPKATVSLMFQQDSLGMSMREFNLRAEMLKSVLRMRLIKELRENMGMIYSIQVSAGATILPSEMSRESVVFNCSPQNVDILIDRIRMEMELMAATPEVFSQELANVKKSMLKQRQLELQKNSFWSSAIRNALCYDDEDWGFLADYEQKIENMSSADLVMLLKQCFLNSAMTRMVVYPQEK